MPKLNCWEFKKCEREPGGRRAPDLGVCPAAQEDRLHGIHDGTNAGRSCWVLAGTLCKGEIQGTFGVKFRDCGTCNFYQTVKREEFPNFQLSAVLIKKISKW